MILFLTEIDIFTKRIQLFLIYIVLVPIIIATRILNFLGTSLLSIYLCNESDLKKYYKNNNPRKKS